MAKYVAFLRGINVGRHNKVPMAKLREVLEKQGFQNLKTLLATGNVVFEGEEKTINNLPKVLQENFGFQIDTIVLPFETITAIVKSDPFQDIEIMPNIRLYVTFLGEKPKTGIIIPYYAKDGSYNITELTDNAVFSVLDIEKMGTTQLMNILEKEFGQNITTRNYNTVVKIAGL
jgi:uncharacterized protein (DUF1697 family)